MQGAECMGNGSEGVEGTRSEQRGGVSQRDRRTLKQACGLRGSEPSPPRRGPQAARSECSGRRHLPEQSGPASHRPLGLGGGANAVRRNTVHTFPLWVGEVAGSDGKGYGVKEGAQRPGIESLKNKRKFRNDSGVRAGRHPDAGGSIPTQEGCRC